MSTSPSPNCHQQRAILSEISFMRALFGSLAVLSKGRVRCCCLHRSGGFGRTVFVTVPCWLYVPLQPTVPLQLSSSLRLDPASAIPSYIKKAIRKDTNDNIRTTTFCFASPFLDAKTIFHLLKRQDNDDEKSDGKDQQEHSLDLKVSLLFTMGAWHRYYSGLEHL